MARHTRTQDKVVEILQEWIDGSLSTDQADQKLKEIGVELPGFKQLSPAYPAILFTLKRTRE